MLIGGAVYDPGFMNRIVSALGCPAGLIQGTTLRFPIYLNLVTAALTLLVALCMREPVRKSTRTAPIAGDREPRSTEDTFKAMLTAGDWIAHTPLALL
jgi:hypothetical protein